MEVEELAGNWERIRALEDRIGANSGRQENRDTPVYGTRARSSSARSPRRYSEDRSTAARAGSRADELPAMGLRHDVWRLLGSSRARSGKTLTTLDELLRTRTGFPRQTWFTLPGGGGSAGRTGRRRSQRGRRSRPGNRTARGGYLEPFRLRALASPVADERLIAQADERFRASHLDWHAAQTEAFVRLRAALRLGASRTESYTQDMAVSRRTVTVLFADVADSTPLGERLDPETLRQVMSRWFERMSEVLVRHGGTVEKFIGDAVMAVFGIPELHEDDALRAVRAGTDLRVALASSTKSSNVGSASTSASVSASIPARSSPATGPADRCSSPAIPSTLRSD